MRKASPIVTMLRKRLEAASAVEKELRDLIEKRAAESSETIARLRDEVARARSDASALRTKIADEARARANAPRIVLGEPLVGDTALRVETALRLGFTVEARFRPSVFTCAGIPARMGRRAK